MLEFQPLSTDPRFQDLSGRSFGEYTVIGHVGRSAGQHYWLCVCSCGEKRRVCGSNLKNGHSRSCGCLRRRILSALRTTHGWSGKRGADGQRHGRSREYYAWSGMRKRCTNIYDRDYPAYGGRGIKVCERWMGPSGFEHFFADMGSCPPGLTLERQCNDDNYEPSNCVWDTKSAQARNRRTSRFLTFQGRTENLCIWAKELGIPVVTLHCRLKNGWTVERAFTTPVRKYIQRLKQETVL